MIKRITLTYFFRYIFIVGCICSLSSSSGNEHDIQVKVDEEFLCCPRTITHEEFLGMLETKSMDMTWNFGNNDHFRFIAKPNDFYFEILFIGDIPDCFDENEKALFIEKSIIDRGESTNAFFYSCRLGNEKLEINHDSDTQLSSDQEYVVCDRRMCEEESPLPIDSFRLKEIVRHKNIIFYTGAGLSAASGIPTMSQLFDLLNLEKGSDFLFSFKNFLVDPHSLFEGIITFYEACLFNSPTNAHIALADLSQWKKTQILTENLDLLHERTGILPYRIDSSKLRNCVDPAGVEHIDYIICIGLSHDDKGFLGWFKKHHPKGKIISIDLRQPSYLGKEDFLLKGDLQIIVPKLLRNLGIVNEKKSNSNR